MTDTPSRKELLAQYKQRKPLMGIMAVVDTRGKRYYLEASRQVEALVNRTRFQLDLGSHPARKLQEAWKEAQGMGYDIQVVKTLPQEEAQESTDPKEDLELLLLFCQEEMQQQGMQPF